jgi:hypothetical protein
MLANSCAANLGEQKSKALFTSMRTDLGRGSVMFKGMPDRLR